MNRRFFALAALATAAAPTSGLAYSAEAYTPALWRDVRASTDPIILNYRATWSLTCELKAEILADLISGTPAYQRLRFVEIDWDTFGPSELTQRLKVRRRSTLLVWKSGSEIARLEADPTRHRIRALLDMALAA